ncbi:MAG: ATPase family, partial [Dehalococcoidia bacterium]|nr:ATPase family [Dehalococcoidia bacterium]
SLYQAYGLVQEDVQQTRYDPVPLHLRNPVTGLMRGMGFGKGYKYAHDHPGHFVRQPNLPSRLQGKRYYHPSEQGFEKEVRGRLEKWWGED